MQSGAITIAEHNQRIFERPGIVHQYAHGTRLTPAEAAIFEHYDDTYVGKRVLDLGVGGGRTTGWLAPSAATYTGIDYSLTMIERCRERFPQYHFEHGDARNLSRFEAGSFDFVLFSFNGIDFVDHEDRKRILKEVARLLVPGGVYAFSSHNLEHASSHSFYHDICKLDLFIRPLHAAKRLARFGLRLFNYARRSRMQVRADGYAILLDPGYDFTMPMYYVKVSEQRQQLHETGFNANPQLFPEYPSEGYADKIPYSFYYVTRRL